MLLFLPLKDYLKMFVQYNANPLNKDTGDCVIRAISFLMNKSWDEVYIDLCVYGFMMKDWGSQNEVWDKYLTDCGYVRHRIMSNHVEPYTVKQFCKDHPDGKYLLATGSHVICCCCNGKYVDTWDSANEIPIFYYKKEG